MKKITREEIRRELEKPNGAAELVSDPKLDKVVLTDEAAAMFTEEGIASSLLVRLAKSRSLLIRMSEKPELIERIRKSLSDESSPKLRRNAARLIGALSRNEADAELLIGRLSSEETRFVRPSILLALGAVGGEKAAQALADYTPAPPSDETERKHFEEETEALKQARAAAMKHEKHTFLGLDREYELELAAPDRLAMQLTQELAQFGVTAYDVRRASVRVKTSDYKGLFEARCFTDALFVIGSCRPDADEIAKLAAPFMAEFMQKTHEGEPPYRYRIELDGEFPGERTAFKKTLRDLLDGETLVNAPSDYELELRAVSAPGGTRLYLKLFTVRDERFLYRKESIPASMNPATAAAVLHFAGDHLTVNARVIDPCCGSGTLLFERGLLSPCDSLTGVDIAHKAIDAARVNAEAAVRHYGMKQAKFIVNDILRFEVRRPYDELICNLPFGNRVGSHSSCEKLYAGLLDKLPKLVKKGGVALLYTMEFTLLKNLIRERDYLEILSQGRTEAGGLTPMIFIIRVN